ncbi:hypothetical protein BE17_36300 [Sorangium cellulosum]|uniref:Uncharacterized protein n=1 Tax=Sorangium cellulosum TaxID=56 RepID=A0A150RLN6_SORCE|nr:hypothetical protein BE17_36300 [Sorangium cellulosum]
MLFNASAAWYEGRYVAPAGSPAASKSEQNVALAGHAPDGVPAPVLAAVVLGSPVLVVVVGSPVPLVVVVLGLPAPLVVVVVGVPAPLVVVLGLPVLELTLEAPPVPAPLPPAPPVSEPSELPVQPATAAARARQEIPTRVKRAVSR